MKNTNSGCKNAVLALALLAGISVAAQDNAKPKHSGGFGHFSGAYETVTLNQLNTALESGGYDKVPDNFISFGGAGYFVIKNVLLGGGGASLSGYSNSTDTSAVDFSGGYGFISGGYVFSTGKRAFFYPNVGVGFGGFTGLIGKTGSTADFMQQLQSPRGKFQTGAGGYFFNIQAAWQTMLGTGSKSGWSIGVKAGYKIAPEPWRMHVNGDRGLNAPRISMGGFYLGIIIGGGSLAG